MKASLSFLGTNQDQLPLPGSYGNSGVEAVLLSRPHLEDDAWGVTWANIDTATKLYDTDNVTFHFPMNNCDYVEDDFVRKRLYESYSRAGALGLAGVIVHSNRLQTCKEWRSFNELDERKRVVEILTDVQSQDKSGGRTWLGLENMPLVGNFGYETDPLFTVADDFNVLTDHLGVVWDVCHAVSSQDYMRAHREGALPDSIFVRTPDITGFNPAHIGEKIVHWHFAAYKNLNNPDFNTTCQEGILPIEADVSVDVFKTALNQIVQLTGSNGVINFEVKEDDYTRRIRGPKIIDWAKQVIASE